MSFIAAENITEEASLLLLIGGQFYSEPAHRIFIFNKYRTKAPLFLIKINL